MSKAGWDEEERRRRSDERIWEQVRIITAKLPRKLNVTPPPPPEILPPPPTAEEMYAHKRERRMHNEKIFQDLVQNNKEIMKQQWHMEETEMSESLCGDGEYYYMDLMQKVDRLWRGDWPKNWPIVDPEVDLVYYQYSDAEDDDDSFCDSFCLDFQWDPKFNAYRNTIDMCVPHTWQIYSLKLTREGGWDTDDDSFDVYGLIHLYSGMRNCYQVIFNRQRDNCQTLTKKDPYLVLTGPHLPPLGPPNLLFIQGTLKLKSTSQSEDKFLSVSICCEHGMVTNKKELTTRDLDEGDIHVGKPCVRPKQDMGKCYLLELTRNVVIFSTVATIAVRVDRGLLSGCRFTAFTASLRDIKVELLDSRDGEVTVKSNMVQLSRCTLSVESGGSLIVCIEHGSGETKELIFSAGEFEENHKHVVETQQAQIDDSCQICVLVRWSNYWRVMN